ncbi:MAG: aminoacyl-tRNA hydrolase [Spirochaetota bacterium]
MADNDRPRLVVFLGNTGSRYARTRHNAGWMLDETSLVPAGASWQQKFKGLWTQTTIEGERVVVLKPQTMMNLSGESVQAAARFFRFSPRDIAVAHDDVELGFGEIGVRFGGGLAGHNGLRSVAHCLATRDFWRIRIGVGRPRHGELHGHVLGRFSTEEEAELPRVLGAVAELVRKGYREGFNSLPSKTSG